MCENDITKYTENQLSIMRTATLTAYPRAFSDIPFSRELFFYPMEDIVAHGLFSYKPDFFSLSIALELEARHKTTNKVLNDILEREKVAAVVEFGCGLSTRRIEFSNVDNYYEIDYSPIISLKKKIYNRLGLQNKFLGYGLDISDIESLKKLFEQVREKNKGKSIAFVSEGLFWYLKRSVLSTIVSTLKTVFANDTIVWITADCPVENGFLDLQDSVIAKSSSKKTNEPFKDYTDFEKFFTGCGFSVHKNKMLDIINENKLSIATLFAIEDDAVKRRLDKYTDIACLRAFG